ncbi:MAG TPA: hypothetical protein VF796_06955 [Humisphaera sp.]
MSVVQSQPVQPVPYAAAPKPVSFVQRVNWRLVVFLLVISAPFAWVIWSAVRNSMNGGISADGLVDLKQLGNFAFDQENGTIEDVPKAARALDGKKVTLRGYAVPATAAPTGKKFQFVYDVQRCCFNGAPQVQERVNAHSATEIEIPSYAETACELTGTLHVRLIREPGPDGKPGQITSVFDLDVETLKPWR